VCVVFGVILASLWDLHYLNIVSVAGDESGITLYCIKTDCGCLVHKI
jgi:hypothetical protein